MKSWYSNSNDIEMKDGSKWKEYRVVFETDSKELKLRFEGVDNYVNDSRWNRSLLLTGWRLLRGR